MEDGQVEVDLPEEVHLVVFAARVGRQLDDERHVLAVLEGQEERAQEVVVVLAAVARGLFTTRAVLPARCHLVTTTASRILMS